MEDLINEQIDEQFNVAEMEREMLEDPQYHIYTAVDALRLAQDRLFHKGDLTTKDYVDKALQSAKIALKLIEG